jgi:glycosyltransferase involved in cell wall biosynthesis
MKVALISEEFPPFMFGGIGSACYDYAMALSKKGIKTTVFCGRTNRITKEQMNENLDVIRLPFLDAPPRFLWFQLQNVKYLSEALKDYSIIHIFNPQAGAIPALLKRRLKKPLVTSIHGLHLTSLKLSLVSPLRTWTIKDVGYQLLGYPLQVLLHDICLKNSDYAFVCNHSTVAELKNMFPYVEGSKISVIYNGINFEEIAPENSMKSQGPIVYCGRLYWAKGVT